MKGEDKYKNRHTFKVTLDWSVFGLMITFVAVYTEITNFEGIRVF